MTHASTVARRSIVRATPFSAALLLGMAVIGLAAAPPATKSPAKTAQAKEKLEPYECGKVERLHTLKGIFLASQPQKEDFKQAAENGIKTVVNLRDPKELDWDEAAVVKELGMEYVNLPFHSAKELSDEIFDKSRKLLADKSKRPYCCIVHPRTGLGPSGWRIGSWTTASHMSMPLPKRKRSD